MFVGAVVAALPASAQTTTWTGGSNVTWYTPGNWSNGLPSTSVTAVFSGTTSTQPTDTIGSGTFGLIQFNSGAGSYTLGNGSSSGTFFITDGGGITVNAGVTTNQKIWTWIRPAATSGTSTVAITNNGTGLLDLNLFLPNYNPGTNSLNILSVGGSGTTQFAQVLDRTSTNVTSVVKNGSGTLIILTSANAAASGTVAGYFSGSTTINGGTLQLGDTTALGSGTGSIVFGGGTLIYSGSNTVDYSSRIRSGTSAISIDTAGQSVTFSSALAASNTGGLTKLGSGTLTLSAANAYTGTTSINAGVLNIQNASALGGTAAGTIVSNSAVLQVQGGITVSGETLSISGQANGVNGPFSGVFVNVSGTNTWAGSVSADLVGDVSSGAGAANRIQSDSGRLVISGPVSIAAGSWNGSGGTAGVIVLQGGGTGEISGNITGGVAGALAVARGSFGTGAWTLSGSNTYLGYTGINTSEVIASGGFAIPDTSLTYLIGTGRLTLNASETIGSLTSNTTSSVVNLNANTLTIGADNSTPTDPTGSSSYQGSIIGTGGIVKVGSGTLTLSGANANTYTGATTVSDGVLTLNKSSGVVAISGSSLQISGNAIVTYGTNSLSDQLSNSLAMTISGTGGFNGSYPNPTDAFQAIATRHGFNQSISSLTMTGGNFAAGSSTWNIGTGSIAGGANTLFTQNSAATVNFTTLTLTGMTGNGEAVPRTFAVFGNAATQTSLTVGSGGLTLDGSVLNLVLGNTGAQGSRLVLNGNVTTTGTVGSQIAPLTPSASAGLNAAGFTNGSRAVELSGTAGTVTRTITTGGNGADLTIAIPITNGSATTANITKAGPGTLTLSAAATYNGNTSVTGGTFRLDSSLLATGTETAVGSLLASSGTVTLGDATTFSVVGRRNSTATTLSSASYLTGTSTSSNRLVTLSGTSTTAGLQPGAPISGTGITNGYVVSVLSGSTFVVAGVSGTNTNQTLTATARNFTTAQTIASLALSSGTGTVNVSSNGGNGTALTINGAVTGAGGFTKTGDGVLTLSAASSYAGGTVINAGTLALGSAGTFANSPMITVGNAGSSGAVLDLTAKTGTFSFGSGQTVGGIGTIRMDSGDTAQFAGTFSPGNSPGIFTFDGGTGLLSGTTVIEIFGATRGTGYDGVDLINGATLNYGSGVLALDFGSWLADQQSYQLFGSGSSSLLGSFSSVTIAGSNYTGLTFTGSNGVWTSQGTSPANQTLTFTEATGTLVIVPEPGALALAGIGIAAAAYALRSRSPSRKRAG